MTATYWQQQTNDTPLFPAIMWSRPENKMGAGKLLIIGGNQYGFVSPGEAFRIAEDAGVGVIRMVLPDSLRPFVGKTFTAGELVPSTPSGSFSKAALATFIDNARWADAVMLAGELGRNSETAMTLESFVNKYSGLLTVTADAADYFLKTPSEILDRPDTLLVVSIEQLQKLALAAKYQEPLLFSMGSALLAAWLHEFSQLHAAHVLISHDGHFFVASGGRVISQRNTSVDKIWRVKTAARGTVFWLQNPQKPLEALASSLLTATPD